MADPEQEMRYYARMAQELEDDLVRLRAENRRLEEGREEAVRAGLEVLRQEVERLTQENQRLEELYESAHESCGVFEAENERLSIWVNSLRSTVHEVVRVFARMKRDANAANLDDHPAKLPNLIAFAANVGLDLCHGVLQETQNERSGARGAAADLGPGVRDRSAAGTDTGGTFGDR